MAQKKRMGRSSKYVTSENWGPKSEQSHPDSREGSPEVMDVLLDISSRLQATKGYIASQQNTERVNHIGGTT